MRALCPRAPHSLQQRAQPWGWASLGQDQGCLWLSNPSPGSKGVRDGSCPLWAPKPSPPPHPTGALCTQEQPHPQDTGDTGQP